MSNNEVKLRRSTFKIRYSILFFCIFLLNLMTLGLSHKPVSTAIPGAIV